MFGRASQCRCATVPADPTHRDDRPKFKFTFESGVDSGLFEPPAENGGLISAARLEVFGLPWDLSFDNWDEKYDHSLWSGSLFSSGEAGCCEVPPQVRVQTDVTENVTNT